MSYNVFGETDTVSNPMTGELNMDGYTISNLAPGVL